MRLLLLSNSRNPGGEYLGHVRDELREFLGPVREVFFVPFAGVSIGWAEYAARVRQALEPLGVSVRSAGEVDDPLAAARSAEAFMVGGGNTFQLLRMMYSTGLRAVFQERVRAGTPYLGWSAGSNLACPTIRTTNDMPVVEPPSLDALGLVPFQINPHYLDADPNSTHMGETREQRLQQFHEEHDTPVLGMREGCLLRVEGERAELRGTTKARLFQRGEQAIELTPPGDVSFLLRDG